MTCHGWDFKSFPDSLSGIGWIPQLVQLDAPGTQRGQADGFDVSEMEKLQGSIDIFTPFFPYHTLFMDFVIHLRLIWVLKILRKAHKSTGLPWFTVSPKTCIYHHLSTALMVQSFSPWKTAICVHPHFQSQRFVVMQACKMLKGRICGTSSSRWCASRCHFRLDALDFNRSTLW